MISEIVRCFVCGIKMSADNWDNWFLLLFSSIFFFFTHWVHSELLRKFPTLCFVNFLLLILHVYKTIWTMLNQVCLADKFCIDSFFFFARSFVSPAQMNRKFTLRQLIRIIKCSEGKLDLIRLCAAYHFALCEVQLTSTCIHKPYLLQTSAIASKLSNAPNTVVPAVAFTKNGCRISLTTRSMHAIRSSISIQPNLSVFTATKLSTPIPSQWHDLRIL